MQQHLTYFDYAATTPVRPEAAAALADALGQFGNPSSRYEYGRQAAQRLKEDRETVARALGCPPAELFFTSCGTESDNWALRRGAELNRRRGRHIVTTAIEHAAVLETCRDLEGQGYEVTYLKPDRAGQVSVEQLAAALRPDTALVSMMLVNNETGAVLPVADCVKAVKAYEPAILFHCDAVRGFLKTPAPLTSLGADLISVSGHKIGAPKAGIYVPALSSDDAKYGGAGTALAPVKAKKEELHGLKYSIELTLPAMSTVFYERRPAPRAVKDEAGGEEKPKGAVKAKPAKAAGAAEPAPRKKPGRKPKTEVQAAAEAPKPKTTRKPRGKKADAGEERPKAVRKSRAKKGDTEN